MSNNTGNLNRFTNYSFAQGGIHSPVKVEEEPFTIDVLTRTVNVPTKTVLACKGDHNSQAIAFKSPKFIDNHEVAECSLHLVTFTNALDETFGYTITNIYDHPFDSKSVMLEWIVDERVTREAGKIIFSIEFADCDEDGNVTYRWGTKNNKNFIIEDRNYEVEIESEEINYVRVVDDVIEGDTRPITSAAVFRAISAVNEEMFELSEGLTNTTLLISENTEGIAELAVKAGEIETNLTEFKNSYGAYVLENDKSIEQIDGVLDDVDKELDEHYKTIIQHDDLLNEYAAKIRNLNDEVANVTEVTNNISAIGIVSQEDVDEIWNDVLPTPSATTPPTSSTSSTTTEGGE